ncbi:GHKL domain-containing protein [Cytobacillus depressus]|uniref:histidine kinase n=1 Tax=Cytobacillus depressus TaxID=1602942 RepID=A0A6L3VFA2_9BACI|nr:ATP-binding protein [Cytobacillus depressus]KAB2338035.1 GHKL domain-containing protein [Cytobacillus depressus]
MIESLLINFFFLLLPVLIFLIFFEYRSFTYNKFIIFLLTAISMILCMEFPIQLEIGYIVDLRYIPFLIFALYTGYRYTFFLYITLNVTRFFIGNEGFWQSLLFSTIILFVVPLLHQWFIRQFPKRRILCAIIVAVSTMIFYLTSLIAFFPELNGEYWTMAIHTLITHALVMAVITILIEKINANREARELLFQSEKIDLVSNMAASVAHEIRNPLTVTNGFLQLLRQSQTITKDEQKYIEFSLIELKRAEGIVSDFLAFSRPQCANMVYSNLQAETEYVKNIMTPYANMHKVQMQLSFRNNLTLQYDKNQIQQCFINLFKNAIEAMRETGGTLSVDVIEDVKAVIVKINDTGIGMGKEEIAQLGRPYYSTKKEGTGLGMMMVYSTISKLNGKIKVESEKGKGTTFIINIPAA